LLSSAEDFVIGGPTEGLAFILADRGYDVFLGNARGNIYARKHSQLNPEKDAAFWRFCWSDIGKKDLPAIIDEVLRVSHQNKLTYVGHMQGTTAFYVMGSERPEYMDKIKTMVSLGPIAYMKHSTNKMLKTIAENEQNKAWQMKNLGVNEFHPSNDFIKSVGQEECIAQGIVERVCQNPFFMLNGYESQFMNMTTINQYAVRLPAGASTKQVLHFAQLVKNGRFAKYAENTDRFVDYDLSRVSVPVLMVYVPTDKLSAKEDVECLIEKLPNVVEKMEISQYMNNLDLIFAKDVTNTVYQRLVQFLKSQ